MDRIVLKYPGNSSKTTIRIGSGKAARFLAKYPDAFIVADEIIEENYPGFLPKERLYLLKGGEEAKNLNKLTEILDFMAAKGVRRDDMLIACGGGTVGDLAGFAAAIYMRGIQLAIMPTTLLAMVDSSIGGKNGLNHAGIKNLVGTIYQPAHIVADTQFMSTLPDDAFLSGMGEIIKHAMLKGGSLFNTLSKNHDAILARDNDIMTELITKSIEMKANLTRKDEREQDLRLLLNAGHTVGHAIEADSASRIPHGQAIATGIYLESLVGCELGFVDGKTPDILAKLLGAYGFPLSYEPESPKRFYKAMALDKKQRQDHIKIPFIKKPGKACIVKLERDVFIDNLKKITK